MKRDTVIFAVAINGHYAASVAIHKSMAGKKEKHDIRVS